jgi:hypothetical protein
MVLLCSHIPAKPFFQCRLCFTGKRRCDRVHHVTAYQPVRSSFLNRPVWNPHDARASHTDIEISLSTCVSLIVRVDVVAVPNMYPALINKIEHVSSHQIPCDDTLTKRINSLSIDQRYTCNSISHDQCACNLLWVLRMKQYKCFFSLTFP